MLQQSGRMSGRRRQLHWKIGTFFFHFRRVCALKTVLQTLKTGILRSTQYCRQRPQLKWCDGASVRKKSSFKYKTQQKRSHQMHQLPNIAFFERFLRGFPKNPLRCRHADILGKWDGRSNDRFFKYSICSGKTYMVYFD